jgi:transcriptional regulator GlxA family with amidase domain
MSFAPLSVFEIANAQLAQPEYEVHVVSEHGGAVKNSFGMDVETKRFSDYSFDTVLLGAAPEITPPSPTMSALLRNALQRTRRMASICVGAFTFAAAGLLDGRRATTHWAFAAELRSRYPRINVEMDRIFITDGPIWTSAGMTSSIDMALGMVEKDFGPQIARDTARTLVVHHRRSGGQSQHSALLDLHPKSDRVQNALTYATLHLRERLSVDVLAEAACLSPRQFTRIFRLETGISPAKAVENLRLDAARVLLERGRFSIGEIAAETGFGDRERMRRAFMRTFGQSPQEIRSSAYPTSPSPSEALDSALVEA